MRISNLFKFILFLFSVGFLNNSIAQEPAKNDVKDFQIFLSQPAKEIRLLMYEKDFTPIQGKLSDDKKSIIIKNYRSGSKVHVKVEYEDGTIDEFVKSPCFIDPVTSIKRNSIHFPIT
jgi:hypothetical protein